MSHSPSCFLDFAAYIFVHDQQKLFCVPEEHVMAISLTYPHRLLSTVVQFQKNMTHDDLPFSSKMGVSEIEDLTDANRMGAFGNDHLADLIGKVFLGMMRPSRVCLPADVVEQEHEEFTVTNELCVTAVHILSRLWGTASVTLGKIWCNLHPPISTMGRLWSTSRCAWHRCLKKRL